jgi:CheY-like chemotaxis protein
LKPPHGSERERDDAEPITGVRGRAPREGDASSPIGRGDGRGDGLVLVVDDQAETRDIYRETLRYAGFIVEEAADGLAAIERAIESAPDVIIVDFAMPKLDGGEVVRRLALDRRTGAIPVLMTSAFGDAVPPEVRAMCTDFLAKPCSPESLVAVVRALAVPMRAR